VALGEVHPLEVLAVLVLPEEVGPDLIPVPGLADQDPTEQAQVQAGLVVQRFLLTFLYTSSSQSLMPQTLL